MAKPEVEEIVEEVMEKHGQSDVVKERFLNFYENAIEENFGGNDLQGLINTVELTEEERLDGS
ncbi:CxC ATPase DNA modification system associated small protein [Haloarchaeobius amylolyticus]|uniref:CxC ATPase DNA modification system associated small protein n=1 Tax=Haloarchaeobius amylolyticus TaxID=1198296 RepID=UPI00226F6B40|nr:CxC ATPase DNA modification system associated small protein [Haloarchaeobius amylolyticus]